MLAQVFLPCLDGEPDTEMFLRPLSYLPLLNVRQCNDARSQGPQFTLIGSLDRSERGRVDRIADLIGYLMQRPLK